MRQLATVQLIADVQPIEGADAIEKVRVNDWWCVAKKDEFSVGDKCVYFEIDSLLPVNNPSFDFLAKGNKTKTMVIDGKTYTGYRLKTIRLRGQISQGLALPIDMFRELGFFLATTKYEGDDVSEELGIVKYEAPIPAQLAGIMKGNFPGFIPKTDEERIQNMGDVVMKHVAEGRKFYITEKLDGTSTTYYKKDGEFGVCSRNLELKKSNDNTQWTVANILNLEDLMPDNYAMQGELVGEGIQGNPLKISGHQFYAYNIYDIAAGRYLDFLEMVGWFGKHMISVTMVPILQTSTTLPGSIEEIIAMADGKSALNSNAPREGIVIRPLGEMRENIRGQEGKRFSFKVISNNYLLNNEQ